MASVFENRAVLLKIYVEENAVKDGQKTAEWIACRACEMSMAGASVYRGIGGFYANEPITSPEFFNFHLSRPLTIEIVDQPEKIEKFAAFLKEEVTGLLMCRFPVEVCIC